MPNIDDDFEKKHVRNIQRTEENIRKAYLNAVSKAAAAGSTVNRNVQDFSYKTSPAFGKKIDSIRKEFAGRVETHVYNAVTESWDISRTKNEAHLKDLVRNGKLPANVLTIDPHREALRQFLDRREGGMNLSQRIWKSTEQFKEGLEQQLGAGIGRGQKSYNGTPQRKEFPTPRGTTTKNPSITEQIREYLLKPDGYDVKPGRGIYKSAYQNAVRVAATETNMAYRTADFVRWQDLPFVTGIDIQLSNNHPQYDMCDQLVGKYPKDFKFRGWHPRCKCRAIPIMATDKQFEDMEDQILAGKDPVFKGKGIVETPKRFQEWVSANKQRIAGWSNIPYWMNDNPEYIIGKVPKPAPKPKPPIAPEPPKGGSTAPAAKQIGSQFTNIEAKIKGKVEATFQAIDSVHGDGVLDDIPFRATQSTSFNGAFYRTNDGKAVKLVLSTRASGKELTLAHEMGHYLDLYSVGTKNKFASLDKDSPMAAVIKAAEQTDLMKRMRATLKKGSFTLGDKTIPLSSRMKDHMKYMVNEKEVWARAYSQFIAEKSTNQAMKDAVDSLLDEYEDQAFGYHWSASDFKSLSEAIEGMMKDLGWMINQ